jgi:acetyltransferase
MLNEAGMNTRPSRADLKQLFAPASVAIIGASARPGSVGAALLENLTNAGFGGEIFAVNPRYRDIAGRRSFPDIAVLPVPADLAIICTPARTVPTIARQCAESHVKALLIISAGFRECGPEGLQLENQLRAIIAAHPSIRIAGPNCLGILVPWAKLNASFTGPLPRPGGVAFFSQSGALCSAVLDWARDESLGFSAFASVGNMVDVDFADLLDYATTDEHTTAVALYIESIRDGRRFVAAAKRCAASKPVIALKAGRAPAAAKAAASHTGAMAGEDAVYEAALRASGVLRVDALTDLLDCIEVLSRRRSAAQARIAIVTNAGGPGVLAADAVIAAGGTLAALSSDTIHGLGKVLPPHWSRGNPVDVIGDAPPERLASAAAIVAHDEGVDSVVIILTPQTMIDPADAAARVAASLRNSPKPVVAAWLGSAAVAQGRRLLNESGIPTIDSPERAARALVLLSRIMLEPAPAESQSTAVIAADGEARAVARIVASRTGLLSAPDSRAILALFGVPVVHSRIATSARSAVTAAHQIGYPVVLKVVTTDIAHKTDVGGVVLNIADDDSVRAAFEGILRTVHEAQPGAQIDGIAVQPMVRHPRGLELIIGARQDPSFGPVVMVGAGGITAELLRDRALSLAPVTHEQAARMLRSLRIWPLLTGYRGRPPMRADLVIDVLVRTGHLAAACPTIAELDINPLLVTPDWILALDARAIVHPATPAPVPHSSSDSNS